MSTYIAQYVDLNIKYVTSHEQGSTVNTDTHGKWRANDVFFLPSCTSFPDLFVNKEFYSSCRTLVTLSSLPITLVHHVNPSSCILWYNEMV